MSPDSVDWVFMHIDTYTQSQLRISNKRVLSFSAHVLSRVLSPHGLRNAPPHEERIERIYPHCDFSLAIWDPAWILQLLSSVIAWL